MMKILFIFFFSNNLELFFLSMVFLIQKIFLEFNNMMINSPENDFLSISLIILSIWLIILMSLSSDKFKFNKNLLFLFKILFISLYLSFFSNSMMMFYFFFEMSLIPIFLIILGWGYQPERLSASLYMMYYTLMSSLPLLLSILYYFNTNFSMNMLMWPMMKNYSFFFFNMILMLAFLVKLPMFLFHSWLPKAHVEAPIFGSMILAGILLKLGGYGLYRLSMMFLLSKMNLIFMLISTLGSSMLSILCCRLLDMKIIIAYSSVVHMSMVIVSILNLEKIGIDGFLWVMLAHGLTSSGMFLGANIIYERVHSRSMIFIKGNLNYSPYMSIFWFLILMTNFAGPFSLNLYAEIVLILSTMMISWNIMIFISFMSFFSAVYSLILYITTQQGLKMSNLWIQMEINQREFMMLFSHLWLLIFCLFSLMAF